MVRTIFQLYPGVITEEYLANGAVTEPKLADGAVATAKLKDANVTAAKLAFGVIRPLAFGGGTIWGATSPSPGYICPNGYSDPRSDAVRYGIPVANPTTVTDLRVRLQTQPTGSQELLVEVMKNATPTGIEVTFTSADTTPTIKASAGQEIFSGQLLTLRATVTGVWLPEFTYYVRAAEGSP